MEIINILTFFRSCCLSKPNVPHLGHMNTYSNFHMCCSSCLWRHVLLIFITVGTFESMHDLKYAR